MGLASALLFAATATAYTVAAFAYLVTATRSQYHRIARFFSGCSWLLHTLVLIHLITGTQRMPLYTVFEVGLTATWLLMTAFMLFEHRLNHQSEGSFLGPPIALLILIIVLVPKPGGTRLDIPPDGQALVSWHTALTLLGYGFFAAASVAGGMYLTVDYQLRCKSFKRSFRYLPSLESLDRWGHRFVTLGFPFLTLGLMSNFMRENDGWSLSDLPLSWGHSSPSAVATVVIWIMYGGSIGVRLVLAWGGRKAACWAIVGFIGIILNQFATVLSSKFQPAGL